jgi:phosphohistidine swiveling domain-containing protein
MKYLKKLNNKKIASKTGAKANNLYKLKTMGFKIPFSYVLPSYVHDLYSINPGVTRKLLYDDIARLPKIKYAIRSSADIEDGKVKSFAGQFNSYLDITGVENIIEAITSVLDSVDSPQISEYTKDEEKTKKGIKMSVIVQEMINPIYSGVAFSRNPLTGIREIIVEAVKGNGISLMQDGLTPYRWVSHSGSFTRKDESEEIPIYIIEKVIKETRAIAKKSKLDVDLEWVYNGKEIYWVQMRSITSLKEVKLYSNRISKEMLAGLIKPLIWSINIPLINSVWIKILKELTGPVDLEPEDLAKSFYYRAYFNMGLLEEVFEKVGIPGESLEVMWGFTPRENKKMSMKPNLKMLPLVPRIISFMYKKWNIAKIMDKKLPELEAYFKGIRDKGLVGMDSKEIIIEIEDIYARLQETAYFNITAPLSFMLYSYIFRKQLEKTGGELASIDMRSDLEKTKTFDPSYSLAALNKIYIDMPLELRDKITPDNMIETGYEDHEKEEIAEIKKFKTAYNQFIINFGHLSDNGNDFSSITWKEEPEKVIDLIKNFDTGKDIGKKHYDLTIDNILPEKVLKRKLMRSMYYRARKFSGYRDQVSYIYTLGYGMFRPRFLELGRMLVEGKQIQSPEDIFYLSYEEIKKYINKEADSDNIMEIIIKRKEDMEASRNYILPEFIYGDKLPAPEVPYLNKLKGVPTSGGYCTGVLKVIDGMVDFYKVSEGDIIVIPHSDVSWTPLFKKAAGVIAESGGMLSHSSIVAREYGIPAVVSVIGAMQLEDGRIARIDGYKGEISILEEEIEI